jgi:predicted nucleic acid-binding protein
MMLLRDHAVILADTGPFCRVAEAGEAHLELAAEYLRANVKVTEDVRKELRRRAGMSKHQRLKRLQLLDVPEGDAVTITDAKMLGQMITILDSRRRLKPGHEDEDRGEVSTVLTAVENGWPVLMDDGFGQKLAAQRGVAVYTTEDLAVEMVAGGHMKALHGYGVYRIVYEGSTRAEFDRRVAALEAQLA